MKFLFAFFALILTASSPFCLNAYSCYCGADIDKEYISPEQIVISTDGIFVFTSEELIRVQEIGEDLEGIYCIRRPAVT